MTMPEYQGPEAPENRESPFYQQPAEDADLRDPSSPRMLLNPFRRPKLWTRTLTVLMFLGGLVLLLLPVTALYYLDDNGNPYDVRTIYATRSDQTMTFPSDLFEPGSSEPFTMLTSVRLGCGTAFNPGKNEEKKFSGPRACSSAEAVRTIAGWSLAGLGVFGFATAFKLPSVRFPDKRREQS
jgi:hypothetical protein